MIRIVIAEGQEMLLGAIGSLLNLEDDMEVVGKASNGKEALILVHRLQPDICIMDIEMPEKSGLEAAEAIKPFGCKVMILTTFARKGCFQRVLQADVRGYLLMDSPSEELACSIRRIIERKRIYSPELMDDDPSDNEREMEVLELLADHQTTNETSNPQSNTTGTVRNYFSTIIDKIKLPTG
ncbi:response regulator transcription factor [Peribacillus cavernae]|uniref:Response regulator transcription factor n=1 Tax=Peribacillus cavernae TaxID=1674310 RepID=A0A433HVS6_9BACI|nr:response regulator transcription factor [Peribacillus cavernae]MDQ0220717.1 two-component system response regulator DesR [Peribacillus cavernae]RUQ32432.1 response regulator transcription factor [Peribacillus cavernae]